MNKNWKDKETVVEYYENIFNEVDNVTKKYKEKMLKILDDDDKQSYRQLVYQKELSQLTTAYSNLTRIKMDAINEISKLTIKKDEENKPNEIDEIYRDLINRLTNKPEEQNTEDDENKGIILKESCI